MALPIGSESRVRGIPTTYNGTKFRSRLEGRWAAFFDLIGWRWIYEPFDTAHWIPDFLIQGASPLLIEVGPCDLWSDYSTKAEKAIAAFPPVNAYCERIDHDTCCHEDDFVVSTVPDRTSLVLGNFPIVDSPVGPAAGLITSDGTWFWTDAAIWGQCPTCDTVCVTHATGIYNHWPCGHHTGGDYGRSISEASIVTTWNQAANPVQWKPRYRR